MPSQPLVNGSGLKTGSEPARISEYRGRWRLALLLSAILCSPLAAYSAQAHLNSDRTNFVFSGLGSLTLAVICWVLVLRRRVRKQTEIITLKLKNEMALEERYRSIFERNLTGLYVASIDGTILDCNEACARILGFADRKELFGDPARASQIILRLHEHALDTFGSAETEQLFERADGTRGWILCSIKEAGAETEGVKSFEGSLVDITQRKLAEEQIQFLAYFDSLTRLPNRILVQDRLAHAIAAAKRR